MKIILAIDGSPCSDLAVGEVVRLPLPAQTIVELVTVEAPIEQSLLGGSSAAFDEIVMQQRAASVQRLNSAVDQMRRLAPGLTMQQKLLEGNPKDAIVEEAARWGADLIVVGSHGYGPIRRFFLGSVSLFVAHHAPCSVLIARPKVDGELSATT